MDKELLKEFLLKFTPMEIMPIVYLAYDFGLDYMRYLEDDLEKNSKLTDEKRDSYKYFRDRFEFIRDIFKEKLIKANIFNNTLG